MAVIDSIDGLFIIGIYLPARVSDYISHILSV